MAMEKMPKVDNSDRDDSQLAIRQFLDGHEKLNPLKPEIGMGATMGVGSDRYPYTITEIVSPKRIWVQSDEYRRIDSNGQSESQKYTFTRNPHGTKTLITLRKNGRWVRMGEQMGGTSWAIGRRDAYQDPSF